LERSVTVRTPESIAFHYELAGLGSRFLAYAIDFIIQVTLIIGFLFFMVFVTAKLDALAPSLHLNLVRMQAVYLAILILFIAVALDGYFIIFEMLWNGMTPGKRLMGIRVVRDGGYPIDFAASLIRNLVRVIELVVGFYLMSIVSMLLSNQNKRLGDLAAGTIIVRDRAFEVTDPKRWLAGDTDVAAGQLVRGIEQLTPEEIAIVHRYVERRTLLPPDVAHQTAARIAAPLRARLGPDAQQLGNDDLLVRIAASRRT
jgi:uncharacterized RDD family membrane protein YckC